MVHAGRVVFRDMERYRFSERPSGTLIALCASARLPVVDLGSIASTRAIRCRSPHNGRPSDADVLHRGRVQELALIRADHILNLRPVQENETAAIPHGPPVEVMVMSIR